jgi:hypothetical protein
MVQSKCLLFRGSETYGLGQGAGQSGVIAPLTSRGAVTSGKNVPPRLPFTSLTLDLPLSPSAAQEVKGWILSIHSLGTQHQVARPFISLMKASGASRGTVARGLMRGMYDKGGRAVDPSGVVSFEYTFWEVLT